MRSHVALVAVVLALLLVTPTGTAALQNAPAPDDPRVNIDVHLASDGDARWVISTTFALNSSNETRAFKRLAEKYEAGRTDVGFSASTFRDIARGVAERTGRDMAITAVNRTGYVVERDGNATGVIALKFTWTEFGRVQGDRVVVDDSFSGGWLDELSENQVLRLHAPKRYGVDTAFPSAIVENGTATWTGPREFDSGQPKVVFLEGAVRSTTTPGPEDQMGGAEMVLAVLVALVVGGLLAYSWLRRTDGDDAGAVAGDAAADGESAVGDGTGSMKPPSVAESARNGEGDEAGAADESGAAGVDDDVDPELLSDEERVERLLRRNGGRMKQGDIVSETGWSNAKVSQLLSSMAEEERVEKLRIGRENLITLADGDAEDLG